VPTGCNHIFPYNTQAYRVKCLQCLKVLKTSINTGESVFLFLFSSIFFFPPFFSPVSAVLSFFLSIYILLIHPLFLFCFRKTSISTGESVFLFPFSSIFFFPSFFSPVSAILSFFLSIYILLIHPLFLSCFRKTSISTGESVFLFPFSSIFFFPCFFSPVSAILSFFLSIYIF
jgi:hypothetical protein